MQTQFSDLIDRVPPAMQVAMFVVHAAHFAGFIILLVQFINIMTQVAIIPCPTCIDSHAGLHAALICAFAVYAAVIFGLIQPLLCFLI